MAAAETKDTNMMGYDDVLESDGQEFVVLPEGDYTFTVSSIERGHFPGGQKIPACNKVTVNLAIDNDQGIASARVDLILYRTVEWKIAAFSGVLARRNTVKRWSWTGAQPLASAAKRTSSPVSIRRMARPAR